MSLPAIAITISSQEYAIICGNYSDEKQKLRNAHHERLTQIFLSSHLNTPVTLAETIPSSFELINAVKMEINAIHSSNDRMELQVKQYIIGLLVDVILEDVSPILAEREKTLSNLHLLNKQTIGKLLLGSAFVISALAIYAAEFFNNVVNNTNTR